MGDRFQEAGASQKGGEGSPDVLAMLRDLGQDSRNMAAAISTMLNDLTVEPDSLENIRIGRAVAEARELAEELRAFMSWVDEDPVKLLHEFKSISADSSQTPASRSCLIRA